MAENREAIPLAKIPPYFGNGAIIYEPLSQSEANILENMKVEPLNDGNSALRAEETDKSAGLIYRIVCPYILSDGQVTGGYAAKEPGTVKLFLSFDEGKNWMEVWQNEDEIGQMAVSLLQHITARYEYWLRLSLAPGSGAEVRGLKVRTTFVASPLALPGKLSAGDNRVTFAGGPVSVPVKTACRWVERHRSDLGISLNAIGYYMNGDEAHRNLFILRPEQKCPVSVAFQGRPFRGRVSVEGLPDGWSISQNERSSEAFEFNISAEDAKPGEIHGFEIVAQEDEGKRRVPTQMLVADAPLVSEAEDAAEATGNVAATILPEASGAKIMTFNGDGELAFDVDAKQDGNYALWLRARWEAGSSTYMTLRINEAGTRRLRAQAMIGFTDWTDPRYAHTKMFAHFGEQYGHWSWYRIPDIALKARKQRLTLGAKSGAHLDALIMLPQNPVMDRAAMNLFQNWNYAPWDNPI